MAKTFKHLFERITDFQNLLFAAKKAQKGKRYRESTLAFNFNLESNLFELQRELRSKTYAPGSYRDFIVRDSKQRLISAAPYRDRVVHHAVMNVIEPLFDPIFISDTYACRQGKGTHAALFRFREFLKRRRYVLKCDIQKYFQTIDHEMLLDKLRCRIADRDAIWLLERIVGSRDFNNVAPAVYFPGDDLFTPHVRCRGIPIGNLTSQFFANLYLNDFDHHLKEKLRVGEYLRYVDDFCVFGDDKTRLNDVRAAIIDLLAGHRLRLHDGKSRIHTLKEGVEFLGFRHLPDRIRVRSENVKRFKRRMRKLQEKHKRDKVSLDRIKASVVSWIAHSSYANSHKLREELIPSFVFTNMERAENEPCCPRR
ncbi:MAG TPA: reverse transcriptase domain-containing protein [bacterium]|nr:reverse transcriptase domain-containing protein [bacterium]